MDRSDYLSWNQSQSNAEETNFPPSCLSNSSCLICLKKVERIGALLATSAWRDLTNSNCSACEGSLVRKDDGFVTLANIYYYRRNFMVAMFMVTLMVTGLFGNFLVLSIFSHKTKKTLANCFMMVLAGLDLFSCAVLHPYLISKFFAFYSPNPTVCRCFEYLNHASLTIQGLVLTSVAIDRFYAVKLPLQFNVSARRAAIMIVLSFLVGITGSLPILVFYGNKTVFLLDRRVHSKQRCGLQPAYVLASVCHYSDEWDGSKSQMVYVTFVLICLLGVVVSLVSLYTCVVCAIYRRTKAVHPANLPPSSKAGRSIPEANVPLDSSSCGRKGRGTQRAEKGRIEMRSRNDRRGRQQEGREEGEYVGSAVDAPARSIQKTEKGLGPFYIPSNPQTCGHVMMTPRGPLRGNGESTPIFQHRTSQHRSARPGPSTTAADPPHIMRLSAEVLTRVQPQLYATTFGPDNQSRGWEWRRVIKLKGARVLSLVTLFFLLSWLPFWVLHIRAQIYGTNWTSDQNATFTFFMHMFYLNNAINPIIYVFINKSFREDCRKTWAYFRHKYRCRFG